MIYHSIRISVKPDAPREQVEAALELLRRMGQEIEAVESWCVGRDFGGEFDYGAMFALKDIEAYRAYMLAPLHRQTDEAGLPVVDKMISQDLTDDEDAAIGDKIREIHRSRFENDPALLGLIKDLGSYEGERRPGRRGDISVEEVGERAGWLSRLRKFRGGMTRMPR